MRSYTFEIVPLRRVAIARTMTLAGNASLETLHQQLETLIGESFGSTYAFVLPDGGRYGNDESSPLSATHATLDSITLLPGETLTWGADPPRNARCTIRCVRVRHQPSNALLTLAQLERFARSAAEERAAWEASAGPSGLRPLETLRSDLALAMALMQHTRNRNETFTPSIEDWLDLLPYELAEHERFEEALGLCDVRSEATDPREALTSRAELLWRAGRQDAAKTQAESNLQRFDGDVVVTARSADLLRRCGANERAEQLCNMVLLYPRNEQDEDQWFARLMAAESLVAILRNEGRETEANELERKELLGDPPPPNELAPLATEDDDALERTTIRVRAPHS